MQRTSFIQQLQAKWEEGKFVCLGLDPVLENLPIHLKKQGLEGFKIFLKDLIDSTADIVCCYKPNLAFYEFSSQAEEILQEITEYIHTKFPDIPVLADAKRGDIANTNKGYAKALWERFNFDATTAHPYLGPNTYPSFLDTEGKGLIALCKTSNPDSAYYQDLVVDLTTSLKDGYLTKSEFDEITAITGTTKAALYFIVAYRHGILNQQNPNVGIVVGATHPETFEPIRKLYGEGPILIPGIGTQGGNLAETLKFSPNSKGQGIIINCGSSIIFASKEKDFASVAREKTVTLDKEIRSLLK